MPTRAAPWISGRWSRTERRNSPAARRTPGARPASASTRPGCAIRRGARRELPAGVDECVLRVVVGHSLQPPDCPTDRVVRVVAMPFELLGPVVLPLLVHMVVPSLSWHGRPEQDDGRGFHQGGHESVGGRLAQVLRPSTETARSKVPTGLDCSRSIGMNASAGMRSMDRST